MSETSAILELVPSPWAALFYDLVQSTRHDLLIASPFISSKPIERMVGLIKGQNRAQHIRVVVVTNLAVDAMLAGSLDIDGLLYLIEAIPQSRVIYLPSLHAKIYVSDADVAVITSANLTDGGLVGNHEYGVLIRDPRTVQQVRVDLTKYAALGNVVSLDTVKALSRATAELRSIRADVERSGAARLRAAFEERAAGARLELLRARAQGKTTHGILCDTIVYLLEAKGPLETMALHPLIQHIHPDLCDDSVELVIDGVHFGKKWKHHVRNAQQYLKRQDIIRFDGRRWRLTG